MTFTTSCFVRVENQQERKELRDYLRGIGRTRVPHSKFYRAPLFFAWPSRRFEQNNAYCLNTTSALRDGFIDCGTDIALFMELSAMRDDTSLHQWFISPGGCFHRCPYGNDCDDEMLSAIWRKATASEIVEYFKTKNL